MTLRRLSTFVAGIGILCRASGLAWDPFPNPIEQSRFIVDVVDFAVFPAERARARISHLSTAPDGRIFANDQFGLLHLISHDGRTVHPYLDLRDFPDIELDSSGPEIGFQSFAFHPQFHTPGAPGYGVFYTAHTARNSWTSPLPDFPAATDDYFSQQVAHILLEWRAADASENQFVPATTDAPYREILRIRGLPIHTMGLIAFNPNASPGNPDYGMLYVSMGDGGHWPLSQTLPLDPGNPYGTILRIDPLGTDSANGRYGIPSDNPFVAGGGLPEVFAYGLRNPQRFFWDTGGEHRMFIADIGSLWLEEINIGIAGANYGWGIREGSFALLESGALGENRRDDTSISGLTYPVAEYGHNHGPAAITVGPVVRSGRIPQLQGKLLFGDFPKGRIFFMDAENLPDGGPSGIRELRFWHGGKEKTFESIIGPRSDLRFGTDLEGRIFLLNKQDNILRLLRAHESLPIVQIRGPKHRRVSREQVTIRGTATAGQPLQRVEFRLTGSGTRSLIATGLEKWEFTVRLKPDRRNVIRIRARDEYGAASQIQRVVVTRRARR